MSEQVQAVQEKRAGEEMSEEKKTKKQKVKPVGLPDRKRKVALLISYNGKGYYGLQCNPGFKSIEGELCRALLNVGVIPQDHHDKIQKMSFQRAARTDKGVSAASNVVSLKMLLNVENLLEKINEQLPPEIRLMDCKRTVNSFNSKNFCDSRTYIYLIPTLAFAPVEQVVDYSYRTTPEIMEQVNKVLKKYLGTHRFHNFTSGIKAEEGTARRYIKYIECGEPFIRNDVEFAVISVWGQSFMMHQIRKMIGLSIAIVKGYCGEDAIDKAWNPEKLDIPKAPGLGLVLEKLHFDGYNKRYGNDGQHEALDWSSIQDKLDKFKEERIFSEIIKTEIEECSMMGWCATLHRHSYQGKPTRWWFANGEGEKQSGSATEQSESSDSENATDSSDKLQKTAAANQTEDDKLSLSNQKSDSRSGTEETIYNAETDKTDATKEATSTCQQSETGTRESERTLESRSNTECDEKIDEVTDMDNDVSDRHIKQAEKIS